MTMKIVRALMSCKKGAAGAEMALVTPLLIIIMFGIFEAGNFFWNQHIVENAVRDGVRFAGRKPLSEFASCVPSTAVVSETRNVIRTGRVSGGTPRIAGWIDGATTITVTSPCSATTTSGIYVNNPGGAPVVNVTATVPYNALFNNLGFTTTTLNLQANAQAAVMGF